MSGSLEQSNHNNPFDISGDLQSAKKMYDQVSSNIGSAVHNVEASASSLVSGLTLPDLHITDSSHPAQLAAAKNAPAELTAVKNAPPAETTHPSTLDEIGRVVSTAATGAVNFAEQHPLQLVEDLGEGAVAGIAAGAAIGALGLGAVVASPWVIGGAAILGAGYVGYQAYTHWGEITKDTSAVGDPQAHTPQEVAQATKSVQNFGADSLETSTKAIGAVAATPVGYFLGDAVNDIASDAIASLTSSGTAAGSTIGASEISSAGASGTVPEAGVSAASAHTAASEATAVAATTATTSDANAAATAAATTSDTSAPAAAARTISDTSAPAATTSTTSDTRTTAATVGGARAAMASTGASTKVAMATPDAPTDPTADAKLKAARLAFSEPLEPPFTLDQTTMSVANQEAWTNSVSKMGQDGIGRGVLSFANGWATNMEKALAAGQPISKEMIESAADKADVVGVTGGMYSAAERMLIDDWKYGPEFKAVAWPAGASPT